MSDRQWEQRGEMIRKSKEAERQRQMQAGGGTAAIAILAEAVQIEDITVRQRTREGTLSNTIKVASLNLTAVNTRNEPMQLEERLPYSGTVRRRHSTSN